MIAGPPMTIRIAGKMNSTSGKISFTATFAASTRPLELAPGCTVEVNGMAVDYDDPNGWSRPDEQTVALQGTACEAIQQGDATVEMVCSCDDV